MQNFSKLLRPEFFLPKEEEENKIVDSTYKELFQDVFTNVKNILYVNVIIKKPMQLNLENSADFEEKINYFLVSNVENDSKFILINTIMNMIDISIDLINIIEDFIKDSCMQVYQRFHVNILIIIHNFENILTIDNDEKFKISPE